MTTYIALLETQLLYNMLEVTHILTHSVTHNVTFRFVDYISVVVDRFRRSRF